MMSNSTSKLMPIVSVGNAESFRKHVLKPLLAFGLAEMTVKDKPNSRYQKYRLTPDGIKVVIPVIDTV